MSPEASVKIVPIDVSNEVRHRIAKLYFEIASLEGADPNREIRGGTVAEVLKALRSELARLEPLPEKSKLDPLTATLAERRSAISNQTYSVTSYSEPAKVSEDSGVRKEKNESVPNPFTFAPRNPAQPLPAVPTDEAGHPIDSTGHRITSGLPIPLEVGK